MFGGEVTSFGSLNAHVRFMNHHGGSDMFFFIRYAESSSPEKNHPHHQHVLSSKPRSNESNSSSCQSQTVGDIYDALGPEFM